MNIWKKGRAAVFGGVVVGIITQAAIASALNCTHAWNSFFTCASSDGRISADANSFNISNPLNRQVVASYQRGSGGYAQAGALDAQGNVISACTTPRDTVPHDGRIVIGSCFTEQVPAQVLLHVE